MYGYFYKKHSSKRTETILQVIDNTHIEFEGEKIALLSEVSVSPRVGNTSRYLGFPDGSSFETLENDIVDTLFQIQKSHPLLFKIYKWEKNKKIIALSGLILIASTYLLITIGIPKFSKAVADTLPTSVSVSLAGEVLKLLDERVLEKSELPEERQRLLREQFKSHGDGLQEFNFQLHFRKGNAIGANAFALPDGTIIITDELVNLSDNNYEVQSVMLHEIGHVIHRHSLRRLIASSGLAVVLVSLTGDVVAASSWVTLLPLILIESNYSQDIEWEADSYALQQMKKLEISPQYFADMMRKMADDENSIVIEKLPIDSSDSETSTAHSKTVKKEQPKNSESSWTDYFSSHPSTNERIKRFEKAAQLIKH